MQNFLHELSFKTSRSGGKGGQNVNKIESKVEAIWNFSSSSLIGEDEKETIRKKLKNRLNRKGNLSVVVDSNRTQLENKEAAIEWIHRLVSKSLEKQKLRIATHPTAISKEKRLERKLHQAERKQLRRKIIP